MFDRYDKLVIAVGSSSATHGVPGLRHSFQLKTVGDAQTIRRRIMGDCLTSSRVIYWVDLIEFRQLRNGKLTMHLSGRSQASIELCGLRRWTYRCRDRCCEPSAFRSSPSSDTFYGCRKSTTSVRRTLCVMYVQSADRNTVSLHVLSSIRKSVEKRSPYMSSNLGRIF